jgi:hypothetical protein
MDIPKVVLTQAIGETIPAFINRVSRAHKPVLPEPLLYDKVVQGLRPTIKLRFLLSGFPQTLHYLYVFAENLELYVPKQDDYWLAVPTSDPEKCRLPGFKVTVGQGQVRSVGPADTANVVWEPSKSRHTVPIPLPKPRSETVSVPTHSDPRPTSSSRRPPPINKPIIRHTVTQPSITWSIANPFTQKTYKMPTKETRCYKCRELGHFAKFCPTKVKPGLVVDMSDGSGMM